ncbi:unnamed protein product [Paramecium sonneborni]|uniref:Uncharacterized protein n=1 Tax=Paramecium sonneborni TaxID=65129 RepID=A0A8S1KXH1_9CILI|nr:unnamed protein product [Paramecium sonneborni]CAD8060200.1 unnamed protein product [Paramecium sonneborni]
MRNNQIQKIANQILKFSFQNQVQKVKSSIKFGIQILKNAFKDIYFSN